MVRLTLARKIAAITLTLWKKGENFDAEKLRFATRLSVSGVEPCHLRSASWWWPIGSGDARVRE